MAQDKEIIVKFYREVPKELVALIENDAQPDDYFSEFYHEQLSYINAMTQLDAYFVAAYVRESEPAGGVAAYVRESEPAGGVAAYSCGEYVGGVMLFMDTSMRKPWIDAPAPAFQAIAKARNALKRRDFSLNFVLITAIKEFLQTKDLDYVYVDPVGPQRDLLLDRGFEEYEHVLRSPTSAIASDLSRV